MSLFDCVNGTENLTTAHTKLHVFHVPKDGSAEDYLGNVAKTRPVLVRKSGPMTSEEALRRPIGSSSGRWVIQTYDIADGEILKIFASQHKGFGFSQIAASQYVRIDSEAPLWTIRVKLLNVVETNVPYHDLRGRFHLLELDELRDMGILINPMFMAQHLAPAHTALFEKTMTEPSKVVRPLRMKRTVTIGGETTTVTSTEPRRVFGL